MGFGIKQIHVQILILPLFICMSLGKLLNLSDFQLLGMEKWR